MAGAAVTATACGVATVRVDGDLLHDAQLRFLASGYATLHYRVGQPDGMPFEAVETIGNDPCRIHAARCRLALLHAGNRVSVFGRGLRVARRNGETVLALQDVQQVIPHAQRHAGAAS